MGCKVKELRFGLHKCRTPEDVIMCASNTKEMYGVRKTVKSVDPNAFVIIMESNETLGEGFSKNL